MAGQATLRGVHFHRPIYYSVAQDRSANVRAAGAKAVSPALRKCLSPRQHGSEAS